jgi:hypothetical protein
MSPLLHVLCCSDYLPYFGLYYATTEVYPASSYLKIVHVLHQTMVYAASVHADLDSLELDFDILFKCFSKPYSCPH